LKSLHSKGTTICHASVLGNLQPIVKSTLGNPIILIHDQKLKDRGRVVVDTGFTKLWTEWKLTGNERYICNATVWLLGIDYRLNNGLPLKGKLSDTKVQYGRTPMKIPIPIVTGADIILVLDGSGSVGSEGFEQIRRFCKELVNSVKGNSDVAFSVIQFGSNAQCEVPLTTNYTLIKNGINTMKFMDSGTDFEAGLKRAMDEFVQHGRRNTKKILFFQTDGDCGGDQWKVTAKEMRENLSIEIFVVGVGNYINENQLLLIASSPYLKHKFVVQDYSKVHTIVNTIAAIVKSGL